MEDSLENWISQLEMDEEETFNQSQSHINSFDEEEFLREILQEPQFATIVEGGATSPSNSSLSVDHETFDNSGVEPIFHEPNSSKRDSALGSTKRTTGEDDFEEPRVHQGTKRVRGSSKTQDHILAERKRRRELTGCIIALSATIPGLKKMDKAYVLHEAANYIKQLEEHVKELENQNKDRRVDSAILITKSKATANKRTTYCETNSDSVCRSIESPLEVEARVLEKEVLIGIRCEKQKNIMLRIHVLFGKLHLSISGITVLPFGNSTLIITIIAQMHDEYSMTMDDLVKSLREDLLESHDMQQ